MRVIAMHGVQGGTGRTTVARVFVSALAAQQRRVLVLDATAHGHIPSWSAWFAGQARNPLSERIWRREGLKVPRRQPKRGRLWLGDGSCVRLRPERPNHVWAYDFVHDRTHDGRKFRMLCVVDEFTREALAVRVERRLGSSEVLDVLAELMLERGVPGHIRSDNGPEFVATAVREWITAVGAETAYIEPGSPWENGTVESFNSKLRDELLRT